MANSTDGYRPSRSISSGSGEVNQLQFLVRSLISKMSSSAPVEVISATNDGGVSPIGYVAIRPLVQQIDGDGNVIDHGIIYNVPYMRIQGGSNAVILDPQVGDIGIAIFCDKDISVVKATGAAAPPGSARRFAMSDAVYLQSILSSVPAQYVRFSDEGIELVSPQQVHIQTPTVVIDGDTTINGALAVNGGGVTNDGVDIGKTHRHTGVTPGSGTSGAPST